MTAWTKTYSASRYRSREERRAIERSRSSRPKTVRHGRRHKTTRGR